MTSHRVIWIGLGGLGLALVVAVLFPSLVILVFHVAFGWIGFARRTLPGVTVPMGSVMVGLGSFAGMLVMGHVVGRWLFGEWTGRGPGAWRVKYTLSLSGLVLLTFVCGMAATGAVHHVGWLMTSDRPMWTPRIERQTLHCGSRMRLLWQTIRQYQLDHDGRLPDDLEVLRQLRPELELVCPSRGGLDYVYHGRGLVGELDPDVVLLIEPAVNHDGRGMNVLLGDGTVRFLAPDEAQAAMRRSMRVHNQARPGFGRSD
jgi:hypothetical protein